MLCSVLGDEIVSCARAAVDFAAGDGEGTTGSAPAHREGAGAGAVGAVDVAAIGVLVACALSDVAGSFEGCDLDASDLELDLEGSGNSSCS